MLCAGIGLILMPKRAPSSGLAAGELIEIGSLDFGELMGDMQAERELRVPNTSQTEWSVSDVRKECGCTRVTHVSTRVSPGDDLVLRVLVDARGQQAHVLDTRIYLRLESQAGLCVVRVLARILPALRVEPSELSLQLGPDRSKFEETLRVSWPLDWPMPEFIATPGLDLQWDPLPVDASVTGALTRHQLLHLRGSVAESGETLRGAVRLRLDARGELPSSDLEIPVFARREPVFATIPAHLVLPTRDGDKVLQASLRLQEGSGSSLMLALSPDDIGYTWLDETRGQIHLTLLPERIAEAPECCLRIQDSRGRSSQVPIEVLPLPRL